MRAIAAVLLVGALIVSIGFSAYSIVNLNSELSSQSNEIQSLSSMALQFSSQVQAGESSIAFQSSEIASMQANASEMQASISSLESATLNPTLVIWNVPQTVVNSSYFLFESVPDTFDYHDVFNSTVPATVYFFDNSQYVEWYTGCAASNYASSTTCVLGSYEQDGPTTSGSLTFKLAEGCGGYVAIYTFAGAGTIYPNVTATYNPSSNSTGSCVG